jgi:hypothetical protein
MRDRVASRPSISVSLDPNARELAARPERSRYRPATRAPSTPADLGTTKAVPSSLAIAGIHGYIGQTIYHAALELGAQSIYGFDPGPRPGPFKRFRVDGMAGGRDFSIEAIYDGSGERIALDGETLSPWGTTNRHQDIVRQSWRWHCKPPALRRDADFAWLVFGLSAALWASCHEGCEIRIACEDDLRRAMQCYPDSLAKRARYPALRWHEQVDHRGIVQSAPVGRDSFL